MTIEKLKTAVANLNVYLEECHGEDDTVTFTTNVVRSIKENYEELIRCKLEIDILNRQKAEIERYKGVIKILENDAKTAKSDAVKEYKEKVKAILMDKGIYPVVVKNALNEAEKEMVGENDV